MPNQFDPYRERLVVETQTLWGADSPDVEPAQRQRISLELHEQPQLASSLDYVRTHTGFCRRIIVMAADLQRLGAR